MTDLTLCPVTPNFAVEVGDLDLSRPQSPATVEAIKQAFWQYAVLIFPDQTLTAEQHLAFAEQIGPLEPVMESGRAADDQRLRPELADVSNLMPDGSIWEDEGAHRFLRLGDRHWHTDSSFKHVPALASLLYGKSIAPAAASPNSPMSAPPGTHFRPTSSARSKGSSASTASSPAVAVTAAPISPRR